MNQRTTVIALCAVAVWMLVTGPIAPVSAIAGEIRVILDTDANNELDDQHAIAYLLFNGDVFDVEAITVNRTRNGGGVDQHLAEAQRVVRLCGLDSQIPVLLGADKSFDEIKNQLDRPDFDGAEAVNFIIERAKAADERRLVLLPVGKLTNIALALKKDPSIIPKVRVVWLGSNYPERGEYNKENDVESLSYILETEVDFEIATVRYGKPSGTDAVRATLPEIRRIMPGKGPKIDPPVTGRHGGEYTNFGDYSINLFENIRLYGDPPSRALFDMAAVAIVKNPAWAKAVEMPAPILKDGRWTERPDNPRKIILWEDFDRDAIMADFYDRMENYQLASLPRDVRRIQPWFQDRRYWQYKGQPVLLLGGSDQDNLYNHPDIPPNGLEAHLDLLVSVGGNYVRNTRSSCDEGNLWAHYRDPDTGLYDLDRFSEAYWQRFRNLIEMTHDRKIIVQIEVFDRFAYARDPWDANPFNPKNNVNYTAAEIGLPEEIRTHPGHRENPFFRSVPELEDNPRLLAWQEAMVDKMLSISLKYDHVLYCISNETNDSEEWSRHWAKFIRAKAAEAGVGVEVTEMWDAHNLSHPMHRRTFDHPDLYSFVDISQNNHQVGQTHWDNMQAARRVIADPPRPMNNVKIYGGTPHGGGLLQGTHKMWHNVLGGSAASRFHRPTSGPGLSELGQRHLRSVRMFTDEFNVFVAEPDNGLLSNRAENEAYCAADPGRQYAVYFPDGGAVTLDVSAAQGPLEVRWLDISRSAWQQPQTTQGGGTLELKTPGKGQWAVLVQARDADSIRPYAGNPYYWQYKGEPVLLLGGSWQDNLFNHPEGLAEHLDLLVRRGGNYVRNVMSTREAGNVFAYAERDGKFDLDRWNEEYWRRFGDFLRLTHERNIIVQIEVFDPHDFFRDAVARGGWSRHPFNPANNLNYTFEESGLPAAVNYAPGPTPSQHPFWFSVPALSHNKRVLHYQRGFVDKMLSISLDYPHVLYCIHNETGEELAFGDYWADHIQRRAREVGRTVFVTDMRRNEDIRRPDHHHIYDNPQRFTFLDVSQTSTQQGQAHYDRLLHVRRHIASNPRPINTTKIYSIRGGEEESVARFLRVIFAGGASARFHRPWPLHGPAAYEAATEWGLGLSPRAQAVIRSTRMLDDAMGLFVSEPRNDLLSERSPNEAYCLAETGKQYAVYFPNGGQVKLDLSAAEGALQLRWLDIDRSAWQEPRTIDGGGTLELRTPGKGHWAVLVLAR